MSLLCLVLILGFTLILRLKSERTKRPGTHAQPLYLRKTCESRPLFCMGVISVAPFMGSTSHVASIDL